MNGVFEVLQSLVRGESVSDSYAEVVEILTSLRDGRNTSDGTIIYRVRIGYFPSRADAETFIKQNRTLMPGAIAQHR